MQMIHPSIIKTPLVRSFKISVFIAFLLAVLALDLVVLPSSSMAATDAPSGNALHFTRTSSQYAATDSAISLVEYQALTLEAWIKVDTFNTVDFSISTIAGEETGTDDALLRLINNKANFFVRTPGGNAEITGATVLSTDTWYHVACTYSNPTLRIYINGVEDADAVDTGPGALTANSFFNIATSLGGRYFDGQIDEVRVWSDLRTTAEIRANMYRELAGNEGNLLAYYKMSNGTGTTLTDNSENSHTGTLTNGPTWVMSGAFSGPRNSLDFDGSNDWVSCGTINLSGSSLTLEAWIRPDSFQTAYPYISFIAGEEYDPNDANFRLGDAGLANNKLQFNLRITDDGYKQLNGSTGLTAGVWSHVAATYDGKNMRLYINGIEDASMVVTGSFVANYNFTIAQATRSFDGPIDEVRAWTVARTAQQIRDNMFRTLQGDETDLKAYYRFDQGTAGGTNTGLNKLYNLVPLSASPSGTLTNFALTGSTSNWVSSTAFNTWEGGDSTAWDTATNWSRGSKPATSSPYDNVGLFAWTAGNNVAVAGSSTVNHMGVATGAAPTLSSDLTVSGNLLLNADFSVGTNIVTIAGSTINTQTLDISAGTVDANGPFDATDANVTFLAAGNLKLGGATVTSLGTLATTAGTVWYDRAGAQTVLADSYFSLNIAGSGSSTKTLEAGTTNVAGDLTIALSTTLAVGSNTLNSTGAAKTSDINGTITISTGTVDADGTFDATDGTITFAGTGNLKLGGATVRSLGTLSTDNGTVWYDRADSQTVLADTYNNLTISGGSSAVKSLAGTTVVSNNLTIAAITELAANTRTLNLIGASGTTDIDGTLSISTGTTTVTGSSDIDGTLSITDTGTYDANGTFDATNGAVTFTGAGNLKLASTVTSLGTLTAGSGTVTYDGISGQTITGTNTFYNLTIDNGHASDKVDASGSTSLAVTNNLSITDGIFKSASDYENVTIGANGTLELNGDITVSGNWSNSGAFTPGTQKVTLDGTLQTLSGATNFYDLTKNVTSADTLTFTNGSANKTTIAHTLDLQGQSGKLLSLRSDSDDDQWEINPQGTRTIGYLDVKDSNNTNVNAINAVGDNCTDSNNNSNWVFTVPSVPTATAATSVTQGT